MAAASFGTTIFQRGMGARVRFASVRSSISWANVTLAIETTISGAMEPANIALKTAASN